MNADQITARLQVLGDLFAKAHANNNTELANIINDKIKALLEQ